MEKQLMERDWRFMLDAVYRVNSAGSVEILEREALECLDALIPSTQGTSFIAEEDSGGIACTEEPSWWALKRGSWTSSFLATTTRTRTSEECSSSPRRRLSGTPTCFRRATGKIASSTRIYTNRIRPPGVFRP